MLGISQNSETHHANLNIASLISHTASISQSTTTTQNIVGQLQESSLDTKKVVETMNASLSDQIGLLNESFEVILRTTVNNVRDQFIAELNSEAKAIKSSGSSSGHILGVRTHQFGAQNTKRCISTGSSQQFRKQVCHQRVYRVWFATISITSRSTTTQQSLDPYGDTRSSSHTYTSSRIIIDVRPHPWLTLRGVLGFIDRQSTGTSSLNYDARLRIYNIIPYTAPIVKACQTGDIASAHELFANGQASPYDVALHNLGYCSTLLDLAIRSWKQRLRFISNSKFSDDISNEIEDLKRKFELFAFLVDCGLDPGEQMPFLPEYVLSLPKIACSSPPSITAHLAHMLRCLVTRSASNPFSFSEKHENNLFIASMEVVPEIAACVMGQESWPLPEPLPEHEYRLYTPKWIENYRVLSVSMDENAYSLLRDPTAIYTRAELKWRFHNFGSEGVMSQFCQDILHQSRTLPNHQSEACDLAIRERLIACLEFGMSPKDSSGTWGLQRISVAQCYMVKGKKRLLESALLLVGWTPNSIHEMFDEEASALLALVLDSFRPVAALSDVCIDLFGDTIRLDRPDHWSWEFEDFYVKNRDPALNEGYRRYFPEEEERLIEVINIYDRYYHISDLPAINGITQEFWD
jgi:hypothetical protein